MKAGSAEIMEANKEVVRRLLAAMDGGDAATFDELLAPDLVVHFPGGDLDRQQTDATVKMFYEAFPDLTHTVDDLLVIDDKVILRATDRGTHVGEFQGIAGTGRNVEFGVIAIYRLEDGRIAEVWEQADLLGLMQQLGVELPGV